MVGIVAVTRFCEAKSDIFSSYIDYIDRKEAVRKDNMDKFNIFEAYTDYMDDETKTIMEEGKSVEEVSALFSKDKDILNQEEKSDLKQLFRVSQKNGSNMWQTVISFDNSYLEEIGIYDSQTDQLNEKLLRQAARKAIGGMLKNEGLENATWTASFHRNTDNIHIHIATVEPVPMREKKRYILYEKDKNGNRRPVRDKNGKTVSYMGYKGVFKYKSLEILKSEIRSELENNKETYAEITRLLRQNILNDKKDKSLIDNPLFVDKMRELYKKLMYTPKKYWNYNYNKMYRYKGLIDDLSNLFINTYHKDDFNDFCLKIEREAMRQTKAYGGKKNDYVKKMLYGKDGMYARLGNAILKELKDYARDEDARWNTFWTAKDYLRPHNERFDPEQGLKLLRDSAKEGNYLTQFELGIIYLKGEYVEKNLDTSIQYLRASLNNGNSMAIEYLKSALNMKEVNEIECYFDLDNKNFNIKLGLEKLIDAAERGNDVAQIKLGILYLKGEYVERNIDKARQYFKAAKENGNNFGMKILEDFKNNPEKYMGRHMFPSYRLDRNNNYAFKNGLRTLENELNKNYELAKNIFEAEQLQREIDQRGEELE